MPDTGAVVDEPTRQGEALAVWALWAVIGVAVVVTYARVDPAELYHVSGRGLEGGLSRALVLSNFPLSLVAIALVLVAVPALSPRAWWLGGPAVVLSAVTAWPGVVDQDDLDARWVNGVPAVGVVLALGLTAAATRHASRSPAPRRPADGVRLLLAALVLVLSLPWLAADLGVFLPGGVFLMDEVVREGGETLAAVHLGHHHGLDGALVVLAGLLLSRVRVGGRLLGVAFRAYVALMLAYGATNMAQDLWHEQVVKRGWVDWQIPSALEPRVTVVWAVMIALAVCLGALLGREQTARPAAGV